MKALMVLGLILFSVSSHAGWKEIIECEIERRSVDGLPTVISKSSAELWMSGPHNGETGRTVVSNPLIPSYTLTFSKYAGGRLEGAGLTTKLGDKVIARSSVDTNLSKTVTNQFVTENTDYQITVVCASSSTP